MVMLTAARSLIARATISKNSNYGKVKVMLKTKFVHILFSQIHQNYAKYTFQTFTVDGITIAYQIESMA